jgi:NADH-quinone oxidoreductase subunit G
MMELLKGVTVGETAQIMAESIAGHGKSYDLITPRSAVFLGNMAQHHPRYAEIYSLAEAIASLCGATFGVLSEAANRVGLDLAGVLPQPGALNARTMLESPRKAYLLVNVEPELDCHNASMAAQAMAKADFVVALTAYQSDSLRDADVLLPVAPFSETSGTFTSMEGRVQSFEGAVKPLGECRPGWKVLRVLGNLLGLTGFDFDSSEQVKSEIFDGEKPSKVVWNKLNNNLRQLVDVQANNKPGGLQRIGEIPMLQSDAIVRRATSLQKTRSALASVVASMSAAQMSQLGFNEGDLVKVTQAGRSIQLPVSCNDAIPLGCVSIPGGVPQTAVLGDLFGAVEVQKA